MQFQNLRDGDRFYYENRFKNDPDFIHDIQSTSLADIIGRNTGIQYMYHDAFASHQRIGGTADADTLTGSAKKDLITGYAGDDIANGGTGDDDLFGGEGHDYLPRLRAAPTGSRARPATTPWKAAQGRTASTAATVSTRRAMRVRPRWQSICKRRPPPAAMLTATSDIIENLIGSSGADTLTGDASANLLSGGAGNDTLNGAGGNDTLNGDDGNDFLDGGDGNDNLDGGAGVDEMHGGAGDDTYFVDNALDVVSNSSGNDTVFTSVSYALANNSGIEVLTYSGTGSVSLTGNKSANTLAGGAGNDTLNGAGGNDALNGNGGNDNLDGGAGADEMRGGAGDDAYFVDNALDGVSDSSGNDTVFTSVSYALASNSGIEALTYIGTGSVSLTGNKSANTLAGGAGNDTLNGAGGNDVLDGGGGDDYLDGGAGADEMRGGAGDDIYFVDDLIDVVLDSGGYDRVYASVNYALAPSSGVEELIIIGNGSVNLSGDQSANTLTGGIGNDILRGNGGNDLLSGSDGNDVLDGGEGVDQMHGGAGDDTYVVDNILDAVSDFSGFDTVRTSVNYTLATLSGIEALVYTGTSSVRLTGDKSANALTSGAGSDTLNGGASSPTREP